MKLSIFGLPSDEMTFHGLVDFARENGFAGIEPYPAAEFKTPDVKAAEKIGEYARASGIAVSCFSTLAFLAIDDREYEAERKRLKGYIDVTAALGCPYFHHTLIPALEHGAEKRNFSQLLPLVAGRLDELSEYAREKGVKLLCEDQGFVFNGCDRFDALCDTVKSDNFGVVLDVGNIYFVDETAESFAGRFAPRINHVHIKDYLRREGTLPFPGEEWYLTRGGNYMLDTIMGYGCVNFEKIFKIMISAGYDGFYSTEYCSSKDAREDLLLCKRNVERYYESALKSLSTRELGEIGK